MTTSWGAGAGRRGDRWEAPRLAYELAAAYVGETAGGGGCGGLSFPEPAAKRWDDLGDADRREVLEALAAQARVAVRELERIRPGGDPARDLRLALQLADACTHRACTACAVALIRVEITAWLSAGFSAERIAAALAAVSARL